MSGAIVDTRSGKIGQAGSWAVEGIGEDFIPPVCDLSRVFDAYWNSAEAIPMEAIVGFPKFSRSA